MSNLQAELYEAECALAASMLAMRTHGHQRITWELLKADGQRVDELRAALKTAERE